MSNRRRLRPDPRVAAYAAAYACSDCTGVATAISRDRYGIWHIDIEHDDGCPILAGRVSPTAADVAAFTRAGITDAAVIVGVRRG